MNYQKIYNDLIAKRKEFPYIDGYSERHHILPRSLGGSDDKDNLVRLSAKEHYIAHLLLCKIYENDKPKFYKMIKAFVMMSASPNGDNTRYFNAKTYQYYKEDFAKIMSESQQGDKNSQYGSMWIYSTELRESKKILKTDKIPEGWNKGRIINFESFNKKEIKKLKTIKKIVKIKVKNLSEQDIKTDLYNNVIDWNFLYNLYIMYGYNIAIELYNINISREALLKQFKKRIKNYSPNYGNNFKIKNDLYVIKSYS